METYCYPIWEAGFKLYSHDYDRLYLVVVIVWKHALAPNGKIDRRTLPAPDSSRPDLEETFVAHRTPTEQQIADIWTQILKLEQIGIHDNFFSLGEHSLLATQVISRLRQGFGIELPLQRSAPRS